MIVGQNNIVTYLLWVAVLLIISAGTGASGLGTFIFTLLVATLIARITGFGVAAIYQNLGGRSDRIDKALVGNYFFQTIVIGGIVSSLIYALILRSHTILIPGFNTNHWGTAMIAVTPMLMTQLGSSFLSSLGNEKLVIFIKISLIAVFLVFVILMTNRQELSIKIAISSWVAILSLTGLCYSWLIWTKTGLDITPNFKVLAKTMAMGFERFIAESSGLMVGVVDLIAIGLLLKLEDLGVYTVSLLLIGLIWRVAWHLAGLKIVDGINPIGEAKLQVEQLRLSLNIAVVMSGLTILASWIIFSSTLKGLFPSSFQICLILVPGALGFCCSKLILGKLFQSKNYLIVSGLNFLTVAVFITFNVKLIPLYGIWATVWIFSIVHFVLGLICLIFIKFNLKRPWREIVLLKTGDFQIVRTAIGF